MKNEYKKPDFFITVVDAYSVLLASGTGGGWNDGNDDGKDDIF